MTRCSRSSRARSKRVSTSPTTRRGTIRRLRHDRSNRSRVHGSAVATLSGVRSQRSSIGDGRWAGSQRFSQIHFSHRMPHGHEGRVSFASPRGYIQNDSHERESATKPPGTGHCVRCGCGPLLSAGSAVRAALGGEKREGRIICRKPFIGHAAQPYSVGASSAYHD